MTKKSGNWLILLLFIPTAVILAIVGLLIFQELQPLPPIQPLPNPNGYNALVRAGEMVSSNSWNYDGLSQEELRKTVENNANALQLARSGLQQECRVPLQFSKDYSSNQIYRLIALRMLVPAFVAEGKLAEKENRFSDAARTYLDTIHLGNEVSRGGVVIDEMVAITIESYGLQPLQKLPDHLDAKSCRETIKALETFDAKRQSWADVLQQETIWERRTFSNLRILVFKLLYHSTKERSCQRCVDTIKSTQKKQGQLLIDLAARAYELEKGRRPASLAELVPDYLKAVPQDPVSGTNMVYSPR